MSATPPARLAANLWVRQADCLLVCKGSFGGTSDQLQPIAFRLTSWEALPSSASTRLEMPPVQGVNAEGQSMWPLLQRVTLNISTCMQEAQAWHDHISRPGMITCMTCHKPSRLMAVRGSQL